MSAHRRLAVPMIVCYDPVGDGPLFHYEVTNQDELNQLLDEYGESTGFYAYTNTHDSGGSGNSHDGNDADDK